MNPSAHGWINKLLFVENFSTSLSTIATDDFYKELRRNGFIYGSNVSVFKDYVVNTDFTSEEICKVNLITAFNYIHSTTITSSSFVDSIIDFYTHIGDKHGALYFDTARLLAALLQVLNFILIAQMWILRPTDRELSEKEKIFDFWLFIEAC